MGKYIQGKNQSELFNALHLLQLHNKYVLLAEYHYLRDLKKWITFKSWGVS
jgi:NADH:ubiquinone oxidoreductase subunit E